MDTKIKDFTDLIAWQEGHKLVIAIYQITKSFPREELYSLVDQLRRAATSITSNVAEGFGRQGYKEKIQYYYMSTGSLLEVSNQLYIARDVGYLSSTDFDKLKTQTDTISKLLFGLIKSSKLKL